MPARWAPSATARATGGCPTRPATPLPRCGAWSAPGPGAVSLDWGQWTVRAFSGRLAVRAEAADQESLRRIQDLLTARLAVAWQDLGG